MKHKHGEDRAEDGSPLEAQLYVLLFERYAETPTEGHHPFLEKHKGFPNGLCVLRFPVQL